MSVYTKVRSISKVRWRCAEGHEWISSHNAVKSGGRWCPKCAGTAPITIEDCQKLAEDRGGRCLSETYIPGKDITWQCEKRHVWDAGYGNIQQGGWCPRCSGRYGPPMSTIRSRARRLGGRCLSKNWEGSDVSLEWECEKGHRWKARWGNVRLGTWCPVCAGNTKGTIEECRALASLRGGRCLSDTYTNVKTKLEWECENGHRWRAIYSSVKNGTWCPVCRGTHKKTLLDCQNVAAEYGGRCLSTEYTNLRTKMLWECSLGHRWESTLGNIQKGRWCTDCNRYKRTLNSGGVLVVSLGTMQGRSTLKCIRCGCTFSVRTNNALKTVRNTKGRRNGCPVCAGKTKSPNIIER
jgi:hypothetical protein